MEEGVHNRVSSHTDRTTQPYSRRGSRGGRGHREVGGQLVGRRVSGLGQPWGGLPKEEPCCGVELQEELHGPGQPRDPLGEGLLA
jgi:hypothetical protein